MLGQELKIEPKIEPPAPVARSKPKPGAISLALLAVQLAAFAAAIWLWIAELPSIAETPGRSILGALFYLMLAWGGTFGLVLWTYMATSLDPFHDLAIAAARSARHALWFVPAMMLVVLPATPVSVAAGMLLMANAARLVVSNAPPQKRALSRRAWRTQHRLFGESLVRVGGLGKDTSPAIMGAFALQLGSFAILGGYAQWAAMLVAVGVAAWTWSWMVRGAHQPRRRKHIVHATLSVITAILLAISLGAVRAYEGEPAASNGDSDPTGPFTATRQEVQSLVNPVKPKTGGAAAAGQNKKPSAVRLAPPPPTETDVFGRGGIPGLILQPGKKKAQALTIPPAYRLRITLSPSKPVSIPFTGEYHLFRESSSNLPEGAELRGGSPMDAIYVTTNGSPMETDAYQEFNPPVDFAPCAKIKMTLTSGETFPASATILLIGAEKAGELGPEIFGMNAEPEETLEFEVPRIPDLKVKAIRVIFRHNPMEASHSTQVAIQRFTFVPRGM